MMKYTKHFLQKIEDLFKELDYVVRYEKGSFQSGYCLVEHKRIVVINRFFETEGRINTLVDILLNMELAPDALGEKSTKLYKQIKNNAVVEDEEPEAVKV